MPPRRKANNSSKSNRIRDIRAKSLSDIVYQKLVTSINMGAFGADELLPSERELCEQYNVSRGTMRKVLRKMADNNIITCLPRVGYFIETNKPKETVSGVIGLIYANPFRMGKSSKAVGALETLLALSNQSLMVGSSGLSADRENDCIRRFRGNNVQGLVITPAIEGNRSSELEQWINNKKPVVLCGHAGRWLLPDQLTEQCDQFDIDNKGGVEQGLNYLLSLGHKKIAFLSGEQFAFSERYAAFKEYAETGKLKCRPEWMIEKTTKEREGVCQAFARLGKKGNLPTAIFCSNDDTAIMLIEVIRENGFRCPEDISVIGFDNESRLGEKALEELTTIDFSRDTDAQETFRLLRKQMTEGQKNPEKVRIPMNLVIRKSCSAPKNSIV